MSDPIHDCRIALERLVVFVEVCEGGLHLAGQMIKLTDFIRKVQEGLRLDEEVLPPEVQGELQLDEILPPKDEITQVQERKRRRAERLEAFARDQHAIGYPYLYGLATVRLWGVLEACVDALVVDALRTPDVCPRGELLMSLKGPLIEYIRMSADEQVEYLAQQLAQTVNAGRQLGLGQFEALLDPIGLSGAVEPIVRRVLLEAQQVRHVFVHRDGYVDAKLRATCPWIGVPAGSPLHLRSDHFYSYLQAATWYVIELQLRARKNAPEPRPKRGREIQSRFAADLAQAVPTLWLEAPSSSLNLMTQGA
jgi:hypothetical protein